MTFQALGNINAAGLKTYFFPEGEHKTITKVDNVGQEDISLSLSDTKKISLSEVAEDGKNNFYRKLSWEIRQAGFNFIMYFMYNVISIFSYETLRKLCPKLVSENVYIIK